MALFKISKGSKNNLPATLTEGYCWYTFEDSKFYIDHKDENGVLTRKALNAQEAEKITGYDIATILNFSDVEIPTSKAVLDALDELKAELTTQDAVVLAEAQVYTDAKIAAIDFPETALQVQSDWAQTDETKNDYIKNKPNIPSVEGLATTDYVDEKIAEVGEGSTEQIQADYTQTDVFATDYIKHRPFGDTELFPETEITLTDVIGADGSTVIAKKFDFPRELPLEFAESRNYYSSYVVVYDGVEHEVAVYDLHTLFGDSCEEDTHFLGDTLIYKTYLEGLGQSGDWFVSDNTGYGFLITKTSIMGAVTGDSVHTLRIYQKGRIPSMVTNYVDEKIARVEATIPNGQVQSDYSELDSTKTSYINNKIVGYRADVIPKQTIQGFTTPISAGFFRNHVYGATLSESTGYSVAGLLNNETYQVVFNGTTYTLTARDVEADLSTGTSHVTAHLIGNAGLFYNNCEYIATKFEDSGEPFAITIDTKDGSWCQLVVAIPEDKTTGMTEAEIAEYMKNTYKVTLRVAYADNVIKLDEKFLPDDLATKTFVQEKIDNLDISVEQLQPNWNETDITSGAYILNKPTIPSIEGLASTDYVDEKVSKVEAFSGDYNDLANKPEIPSIEGLATESYVDEKIAGVGGGGSTEQVQADWNETDTTSPSYIKNKPSISGDGSASIQANWTQNDSTQIDYIKNRPFGIGDTVMETVIPETQLNFFYDGGEYGFMNTPQPEWLKLWAQDWENVKFTWDGTEYICEPKMLMGIKCIGNVGAMDGSGDTGEPFVAMMADASSFAGQDAAMIFSLADAPTEILPSQSFTFTAVEGTSYYSASIDTLAFVEGRNYVISFIGSNYTVTATSYTSGDDTYIGVGNPGILGLGTDSGQQFFVYTITTSDGTQTSAIVTSNSASNIDVGVLYAPEITHTVKLEMPIETIITLDPKFLGDVPWSKVTDKPFGTVAAGTVVTNETVVLGPAESTGLADITPLSLDTSGIINGAIYTATINGTSYVANSLVEDGLIGLQVLNEDQNEIMIIVYQYGGIVGYDSSIFTEGQTLEIKITLAEDAVKKIDSIYLPDDIGSGSGLPESTTSDSGKVLTVSSDGTAAWSTPANELPAVTTDDNGKIIEVTDGAYALKNFEDSVIKTYIDDLINSVLGGDY